MERPPYRPNVFRPDYEANAQAVTAAILRAQPLGKGVDYSQPAYRKERELIAVSIHNGLDPEL